MSRQPSSYPLSHSCEPTGEIVAVRPRRRAIVAHRSAFLASTRSVNPQRSHCRKRSRNIDHPTPRAKASSGVTPASSPSSMSKVSPHPSSGRGCVETAPPARSGSSQHDAAARERRGKDRQPAIAAADEKNDARKFLRNMEHLPSETSTENYFLYLTPSETERPLPAFSYWNRRRGPMS